MERGLRVRLACAKVALADLDESLRPGISATQSRVIVDLVSRDPALHSVSIEGLATLQKLASEANWHARDKEIALRCLTPKRVVPKDESAEPLRRASQHFAPAILSYFTRSEWTHLVSEVGVDAKMDLIRQRVGQLSGLNLAEQTMKLLASFVMLLTDARAIRWDMVDKRTNLQHFKNVWKTHKRRLLKSAKEDDPYLAILPSVPAHLQRDQPLLWAAALPHWETHGEKPTPCPINLTELINLNESYGCRGRYADYIDGSAGGRGASGFAALMQQMALMQQSGARQWGNPALRLSAAPSLVDKGSLGELARQHAQGAPSLQLAVASRPQELALGATTQQSARQQQMTDFDGPPVRASFMGSTARCGCSGAAAHARARTSAAGACCYSTNHRQLAHVANGDADSVARCQAQRRVGW